MSQRFMVDSGILSYHSNKDSRKSMNLACLFLYDKFSRFTLEGTRAKAQFVCLYGYNPIVC